MAQPTPKNEKQPFLKNKKRLFGILFLLLIAGGVLFFIFRIERIAENRLLEFINSELAPNAEVEFGEFSFSILPAGLIIRDVRLLHLTPFEDHVPEKSADAIKNLEINFIEFSGINLYRMLLERQWLLNQIVFDGFNLELVPLTTGSLVRSTPFGQPPPFLIENILFTNGSFTTFTDRMTDTYKYSIHSIRGELINFSVPDIDDPVYSYFQDFEIQTSNSRYKTGNGFYQLGYDSVSVSSRDQKLYMQNGKAEPLFSALEMAEKTGYETDQFSFNFDELFAEQFDFDLWFQERGFIAEGIRMLQPVLHIHRDKSMPREERDERPLPIRYLNEYPQNISVDSIMFRGGTVSYTEDFSDESRKGSVSFYDTDLTIENVKNQDHEESISAVASTTFMDLTGLNLRGEFSLDDNFSHQIRGSMSELDLTLLNDSMSEWLFVRFGSGTLDQLDFYFSGDDDRARGEMHFIYHDLEIRFLDEETLEETRNRRLRSFIANLIRIRSENTFDDPRTGTIDFERDKTRSIFNYWWKSVASGLEDSVTR